jgi:hypothetical protein
MEDRVITLGNVENGVSFNEAFGGFDGEETSEAKGRGRARRQAKKMAKIENRQTRRSARKTNRQTNRANRVQAKQDKKTMKLDARQQRKNLKTEQDQYRDNLEAEQDQYRESLQPQDEAGFDEQEGYAEEQGYEGEEEGYPEEQGYEEEEEYGYAQGEVSPEVQDIANKIEWNRELISRLDDVEDADKIVACKNRILELQNQLSMSSADGSTDPRQVRRAMRRAKGARSRIRNRGARRKAKQPVMVDQGVPAMSVEANKIIVEGENASGGNGQISVMQDDALMSFADGSKKAKNTLVTVGIGLGIAVVAIIALKKFKVI